MDQETDVLIVGGGMIGSVLERALSQSGLRVILADAASTAAEPPDSDHGTMVITAKVRSMLETLGLWDAIAATAEPILTLRLLDGQPPAMLQYNEADFDYEPFGWTVASNTFPENQKSSSRVVVRDIIRNTNGVHATLNNNQNMIARLVIAADGATSPTRNAAGIQITRWQSHRTTVTCTVTHTESHDGFAYHHFLPEGSFSVLPLADNRCAVSWTERETEARTLMDLDDNGFLARLSLRLDGVLGALTHVSPRHAVPTDGCIADAHVATRLALVGDAALSIRPTPIHDVDRVFLDIATLVEVVIDAAQMGLDVGDASVLSRYHQRRRPEGLARIVATEASNRLFLTDIAPIRIGRGLGLGLINAVPSLKKLALRRVMVPANPLPRLFRT